MIIITHSYYSIVTAGMTALMYAAKGGDINIVEYLLTKGASIHERDDKGKMQVSYQIRPLIL